MNKSKKGFSTNSIHCGQDPMPISKAVVHPIYLSTTFAQENLGEEYKYEYTRCGNPTRDTLQSVLAKLENGKFCSCFASGLSATFIVFQLLKSGDHIICSDDVYGGTRRVLDEVFAKKNGFKVSYHDLSKLEDLESAISTETKMIWSESPTNPKIKLCDIEAISSIAKNYGVLVAVDNTFCSPLIQNPLDLGADLVIHSTTKFICGHSDVLGGAVISNDEKLAEDISYLQNAIGAVPSPFDNYMALRSIKTLKLRVEQSSNNAELIANFLHTHPNVTSVYYPTLFEGEQKEIFKKQMSMGGGVLSFEIKGGEDAVKEFFRKLKIFTVAESLGGVESLIEHPLSMTHASVSKEELEKIGVTEGLIRVSVGLEDAEDLINDLKQAL